MTANTVTLALPSKGAIAEPTLSFLRDCGLKVDKPNQRQYIGYLPAISQMQVLFQRVTDILYKVADGTAHIGITGLDIVRENPNENLVVIHDRLGYGQCSLVVAIPETWVDVENMTDLLDVALDFREQKRRNLRIATKYPTLTRQFLHNQGLHHFTLVKADGAIEAAPTLGYADIIVDLTQTGTTLRENHLKILVDGIIVDSQACLIGNRNALKNDARVRDTVRIFLEYIDAAMHGRNYYQIIANIKGDNAEDVAYKVTLNPLTRGLQGPTIAPIYSSNGIAETDGLWYTATIITNGSDLLNAVQHLRSIGGTQTIVTPVRYIFMEVSSSFARLLEELHLED
jgi:ATP phosphoribosyltransferase